MKFDYEFLRENHFFRVIRVLSNNVRFCITQYNVILIPLWREKNLGSSNYAEFRDISDGSHRPQYDKLGFCKSFQ